jgi:flagellar biosynthesis/type III secretory pathway M-ring protein FliF/YscJ
MPVERPREPVRAIRPVPAAEPAAEIARRDPAKAAAVVRGWMRAGEEAP